MSSPARCNNTSVINPIPIVLIVIFCICALLFFSVPAYGISNRTVEERTRGSSNSSIIQPGVDRFGVEMLYPTKAAGQEWHLDMVNPTSDGRFNPQDQITSNPDGSWKMRSDQVRMSVYTSNGYKPHEVTSDSGHSVVAARGFMGSPNDWRDVEITGFVKLNQFTENDNFVWYARGGKHTDSDHCQGSAYKGNLFYHGETQFSKEQWHVSYAKSPTIKATNPLSGKWIGFKFVVYNFVTDTGKPAVKLENWIDVNADGKNWVKVYEGGDAGKWGRSGEECQVKADQILTWGGPIATFRWDFAQDVDFRDLSVREITGDNGTTGPIHYFTGTSTSSNVPKFGNSITSSDGVVGENLLLSEALGNKFRSYNLVNRSLALDIPSSPNSNNRDNEGNGESYERQQVSSGTDVYVLWVQGDEDNTDLYLKISRDGGATFGNTINLSNNPASLSYHPKIVASGENVYIVWEDDDGDSGNSDIFFMKSSDAGNSFTDKSNLSNDPSGSGTPQLSVSGGEVYVAWMGTSPDNTDIFLAQSQNDGTTFTLPENLSNDPDISFNPILSVNGTHVYVEWTDQDDSGLTKLKSKTLPHATYGFQDNSYSYADLSGALNSTYSSPGILVEQNSTADGNESKTDVESENMTNTAGILNQSAPAPTSTLDGSSLGSNSSVSSITRSEVSNLTIIHEPNLDNITKTKNVDTDNDNLVPSTGKLIADKIAGQMYAKINGSLGDHVDEIKLSAEDKVSSVDGDPKNMKEERLAAITAAENALRAKENENGNPDRKTNSSDNAPGQSTIKDEIITIQASQNMKHKESEQVGSPIQPNTTPLPSDLLQTQSNPVNSRQPQQGEDLKDHRLGAKKEESNADQQGQESNTDQQGQDVVKERQRPQENVMTAKDKAVADSRIPDSDPIRENELSIPSSVRTHADDVERKRIANSEVQKVEDNQKTMNNKRFVKSENAKEQSQKSEARNNVQDLIQKAESALDNAQDLIKQSKLANQKAHAALEEAKSRHKETSKDQEEHINVESSELNELINEAKISDQKAQNALEKYNNLRRAANSAVGDFNTRFN